MTEKLPSYYRARISAFRYFIELLPKQAGYEAKVKASPYEILKYGVIHPDILDEFDRYFTKLLADYTFSDTPLTFTELCSFNTWFAMHHEKIAGEEIITTSREFPIGIKGSKEDVQRVVGIQKNKEIDKQMRIRIIRVKAQAKIKLLKLIK